MPQLPGAPAAGAAREGSPGRQSPLLRIAVLLFVGIALVQLAFSPLDLRAMGYSDEEVAASFRLLSWLRGDAPPAAASALLSPQGIVTRHGILEPLIKLPFAAAGSWLAPLFPHSPRFAERFVALVPLLQTAFLAALLFVWCARLAGNPLRGLTLALGGAFCTLLWPYAYTGLEPTQAVALLLAGFLALSPDPPAVGAGGRRRGRTFGFLLFATVAVAAKSTGLLLLPAIAYLTLRYFRRAGARRPILASLLALLVFLAAAYTSKVLRSYSFPVWVEAEFLRHFIDKNPVRVAASMLMLLFSGNKGIIVYSPVAVLGLASLPAVWRKQREIATFALLLLGSLLLGFSVVGVPAEETWGPRYLYCVIPPLLLCLAAAWRGERLSARRRIVLAAALLLGFAVSALGSLFYYGRLLQVAQRADQATLEALWGDPVWNPVAMNLRFTRLWLGLGDASTVWTPVHHWWFTPPPGLPPEKSIDLAFALEPQPLLLRRGSRGRPRLMSALAASLVAGLAALALAGLAARRSVREA